MKRSGSPATAFEGFVFASPNGYYAQELADILHAEVQEPLRHLVQRERLSRAEVDGQFLYTAIEAADRRQQTMARRSAQAVPLAVHSADLQVSPDELKAAIILFYGLLDEQQRRLFAGLESIRLGHGGDTPLGDFLGLERTPSPAAASNCWTGTSSMDGHAARAGGRQSTEKKRQS